MFVKLLKQAVSVVTLVTFIATNSVYASPDSKSIFKNKKVDYQKISNQTENVIQKKKAILNGEDAKQSESQQKEARRILSSHLSDISLIHLPQELGRIVEVYQTTDHRPQTTDQKLIVHIQDLHTNPEAEYNLAKILELLLNDYKMGLVCSEGAVGALDTKEIASFPDYAAREKVGKIFVNAGELTGEEYLAITKYPDIPIWGIESEDIYFKNIIDFNKIMKFNKGSQVFISQAKKALEELKNKLYTKELLDLDQKETDYKAQKLETADYIDYLTNYINKLNISASNYKNISLLTETMSKEKTIDQLKIMNESQNVLLNLQSFLAAKSLRSDSDFLMAQAKLFKDQKISPFSFYSYLKDLANKHIKDDFAAKYPDLNSFIDYLAKVNSIDSTDLFLEFENLNFEIKQALSKTEEQKTLVKALRNINFLEGFFNLKVSNEELDYYISNRDSHKVAFFESFLKPALKKYNVSAFIDYNAPLIDPHLTELEEFYKVVKERDVAMVNNSLSEIEKRNSKVSTLIAGGFHTKGITKLLKEKGYSYIVVSPYSKTDMDEENYHFLLTGQRKPIIELLNQLDIKEVINRFISPALRVPLASNTTLLRSWNTKHIPGISESTGFPAELLKLEPLLKRAGEILGFMKQAEKWTDLPFEFIKAKVINGRTVVWHLRAKDTNRNDRDIYFTGQAGKEELLDASVRDFNQAGILRATITPPNAIGVQKSTAIAPAVTVRAQPAAAAPAALASNQDAGSVSADLKKMHQYFRELEESAKSQGEGNRFTVTLYIKDAAGKAAQEKVSIPLDRLDGEKDNLVKYLATLISIRGVLTGVTEVGVETNLPSKISADSLIKDIDTAVRRDFGKTQYFATFGKSIEFKEGEIQDEERAAIQDQAGIKIDYAKGDAIGFDVGGTNIKVSVRRNDRAIFNDRILLSVIDTTLGEFIKAKIKELDGEYGQGLGEKPIYITIPGPVTPEGRIVDITNIEESRKGTKGSFEKLQSEMPNIKFQNDANVAAFYYMVETDLSNENVILNTLGTGLGLGIIINGRLTKGPQEAHIRIRFDKEAYEHKGFGMKGDLESYANAEFAVQRAKELAGNGNISLPSGEITPKTVGDWLLNPEGDNLKTIAMQVYAEFGNNLAVLYKEISRVTGIKNWKVVYVGGIAVDKTVETIIKGAQDALKETPDIKISFIALPEAPMAGSYGATYLGIQEQQMAGQSLAHGAKGNNQALASNEAIRVGNLQIVWGSLIPSDNVNVKEIDGMTIELNELGGKKLKIQVMEHKKSNYAKIGNCVYLVKGGRLDISKINPLGNIDWFTFIGKSYVDFDPGYYSVALPVSDESVILFPVNKILHPSLLPKAIPDDILDKARSELKDIKKRPDVESVEHPIQDILNLAAIVSVNGEPKDFHLALEVLKGLKKYKGNEKYNQLITNISEYLMLSYAGCDWDKWTRLISKRKQEPVLEPRTSAPGDKDKTGSTGKRPKTIFEAPGDLEIIGVEVDEEIPELNEDPNDSVVKLGLDSIKNGRVVSVPIMGGTATTPKKTMGAHKMVHLALKAVVQRGREEIVEWISLAQARLGLIIGQNKDSKVVIVTGVAGADERESDASVRAMLDQDYSEQLSNGQFRVSVQKMGLVLDPNTGKPLRYDKDGTLVTCAENHLWAFLSVLMNKKLVIELLNNSDGILCLGNGDNILNYPRAGMVGRILKARQDERPLATVVAFSPAIDKKEKIGFAVKVTYENRKTGRRYTQSTLRELSEFPMKSDAYGGIKISIIDEHYKKCESNGWFLEDILGDRIEKGKVLANVAFYVVDLRLILARIFSKDENSDNLRRDLDTIEPQRWVDAIIDMGERVRKVVLLHKEVPNETDTAKAYGYMTEQMVQDLIVTGLPMLARDGSIPEFESVSIPRDKVFLPYKGRYFGKKDDQGNPVTKDGVMVQEYDLIYQMPEYVKTISELAEEGIYCVLGKDRRVLSVTPVNLKEVRQANRIARSVTANYNNRSLASNTDLAVEIKSLVPKLGAVDEAGKLRKIFEDLKARGDIEGLKFMRAELENSKRAFSYAMDSGSGGNAYSFTRAGEFLREVEKAILKFAVEGKKEAYLAIKSMNPLEAIAHFESGLENTIANLPEDLFGHGFGYDVRGNALKIDGGIIDMTPENLYAIGKLLALKYTKPGDKYLVTGDTRMHTPILRYAMVLGAASVGADVDFSEEELSSGAHNVYSAENPKGYKVQVQISGSHGVFQKNGAKIKADIGNNRLDPVYGDELAQLHINRAQLLDGAVNRNINNVKIQEVSGIEDAIVDMYDKTLPPTTKDEILIIDTRAGCGGSLAAKLLARRGYEVIDVDEVFGITGQTADMTALLSDKSNVDKILSLLNEKWANGKHKIVFMLNMHPDPLMRRGIWDPSKPEAMVPTVTLVKAINGNLKEGMPQAIGGVYDGDADRVGAVKENSEDIPAFEMTMPYYQRFLLDPQNKAAIIQMASAGIGPLWLALDVRANSKLQNTLAKINGILKDEYKKQYNEEYSGDMLNLVYINTGYPAQLAFIAWRIDEMKKLVEATPTLRDAPRFMENFNHLIHTYYTAEASGHNFFHASPGNPERPCDCAIAAFISLINIKETMDDTEAPVLGIETGSKAPLVTLFETFPPAVTSNEIGVIIPNGVKISTAHKLGEWLKKQYGSELLSQKAEKIKIGDLEYEPAENGLVTVAGYKAQLKSGDSILIRWSNTGEQLTLLFEGHDIDSLINNVETVLNRMKEEKNNVTGLKLDDLEKELAGLKQKRDSSQRLASNEGVIQTLRSESDWRKRVEAVNSLEWDFVNEEVFTLVLKSLKDDPHPAVTKAIAQKLIFDGKIWENKGFLVQAIDALISTADEARNDSSLRVAAAISLLKLMEQFSAQPIEAQRDVKIRPLRTYAAPLSGLIFDHYKGETLPANWPADENTRRIAKGADKIIGDFIAIADRPVTLQGPSAKSLASNNELTQADIQRMIEGKAVPAAKVIGKEDEFRKWVDGQPSIVVTIVAMDNNEYNSVNSLHGYNDGQVIVITVGKAEELRVKFTEDFVIYDQNIFGSFNFNDLSMARKTEYNRELEKARASGV